MASYRSYKNQNSSYQGKFQGNVDQGKGNLDQASEELELSEFEFPGCTVVVFLYFPCAYYDYTTKNKS